MTTEYLKTDIIREEGLRLVSYQDTRGFWTIGYGHKDLTLGPNVRWGITHAKEVLDEDIVEVLATLDKSAVWWRNLNGPRQDVIAMMAFQLGIKGLLNFKKTIAAIRSRDFILASEEMLNSDWNKQTPHRAARLAEQMKTGERNDD